MLFHGVRSPLSSGPILVHPDTGNSLEFLHSVQTQAKQSPLSEIPTIHARLRNILIMMTTSMVQDSENQQGVFQPTPSSLQVKEPSLVSCGSHDGESSKVAQQSLGRCENSALLYTLVGREAQQIAQHPTWSRYVQASNRAVMNLENVVRGIKSSKSSSKTLPASVDATHAVLSSADTQNERCVSETANASERAFPYNSTESLTDAQMSSTMEGFSRASTQSAERTNIIEDSLDSIASELRTISSAHGHGLRCVQKLCPSNRSENPVPAQVFWHATQRRSADEPQLDSFSCQICKHVWHIQT